MEVVCRLQSYELEDYQG